MRLINTIISLAPAPLFYTGAVMSWFGGVNVCSTSLLGTYEMTIMWAVMGLAHTGSWIIYWERQRYVKLQQLPDKQQ
jgi:hypothetical protein